MLRKLHVIVVAFYGAAALDRSLHALGNMVEVTVIDNSSSKDVRMVSLNRGAGYIDAGANLGFAGGVNLALRNLAESPPLNVLLLNPDAVLEPQELELLVAHLHCSGNERVAAVAPRLIGLDGMNQRVVWPFPSPSRACLEAFGFGRLPAGRTFVTGAVLLLRWEAVQEVGLFDERFFLYAEEADWQRRAVQLSWSSELCNDAVAHHVGAGTSDDPRRREALFHAGQETYIRKWYGRTGWALYRVAVFAGAGARMLALKGDRRAEAARRALLYLRGPRRCALLARE